MNLIHVPQPPYVHRPSFTLQFSTHDDHPDATSEIDFGSLAEVRAYLDGGMKPYIREWRLWDVEGIYLWEPDLLRQTSTQAEE
ncbi:hypothetical protein E7T06_10080 [Deinococcus sp. Arct2-2]|uniref:hypothetical protein n=1 Tax=Deinococcus sp. Arct2-2 TaxID=2568653 RepID=UPI0010A349F2|nr:hypothetical protein [Deinococcus sp. Arct2-2]THF69842.1 hypothetical protein E7T06_10080 [Deinococcus sp. Arct2-2]